MLKCLVAVLMVLPAFFTQNPLEVIQKQPLVFHYETTSGVDAPVSWSLYRSEDVIEIDRPSEGITDIWRNTGKEVLYQRFFHLDRKIVEYTQGDLRSVGLNVAWEQLSSILDPNSIGRELSPTSETRSEQWGQAVHYIGQIGEVEYDVWWLPEVRAPLRMVRRGKSGKTVVSLTAFSAAARSLLQQRSVDDYQKIDFADLEDYETDSFVRKLNHARRPHL